MQKITSAEHLKHDVEKRMKVFLPVVLLQIRKNSVFCIFIKYIPGKFETTIIKKSKSSSFYIVAK